MTFPCFVSVVGIAFAAAVLIAKAPAAPSNAALSGRVVDEAGGALPGATVRVHLLSGVQSDESSTTDSQGRYSFPGLPDGEYKVNISAQGFRDKTLPNVRVAPGQQLDLGVFRLELAGCSAPGVICDDFGLSVYNDPTHAQGTIQIPRLCAVDIDEGKLVCNVELDGPGTDPPRPDLESDFWVRIGASGEVYLTPRNGARLALNPPTEWSKSGCISASYSSKEVQINGLPIGSRVCIRTNRDRYAQVAFFGVVPSGAEAVKMAFITWQGEADAPNLQNTPGK